MAITLTGTNYPHHGYIHMHSDGDSSYTGVVRLVLKRTIQGEFSFISVYTKAVELASDLDFSFDDYYCRNNYTYQYKVVYLNSEGGIVAEQSCTVQSSFDVLVVCDKDALWCSPLNVAPINFNTIKPYAINQPIYSKKPSYYNVTMINYDEGTCTGIFLEMVGPENNITFETAHNWKYRRTFKEFLTEGNAKILKSVSGEMWLVGIKTDGISDSSLFTQAEIDGARQLEFGWIEIGDVESEQDLYENGFINVPPEFFSGV